MKRALLVMAILVSGLALASERPATKIIGGDNATMDYPWVAGLHFYDAGSYDPYPFCGGSLIAPGWVVTAAHCVANPGQGGESSLYSPAADEVIIRLDLPDLDDEPQHFAAALFVHPQYGITRTDDSDVALIQLMSKAGKTPISIADNDIMEQLENSALLDDVVRIIGWGRYDDEDFVPDNAINANQPDFLQEADLDYLPFLNRKCRDAWSGAMTENMVCAWEPNPPDSAPFGQDACFGDSGGPLMLPANTVLSAGTIAHQWLLGATSFGSTSCTSDSQPGVYTRLVNFVGWMEQTTALAGDPVVDAQGAIVIPAAAAPNLDFTVQAAITNGSHHNDTTATVVELTLPEASLTPVNPAGCTAIVDGWRCNLGTLAPGQSQIRSFTANWNGADESLAQASIQIFTDEDDYRVANNSRTATSVITQLPDPSLDPFSVLSNRNRTARVSITARNQSPIHDVSNAVLTVDFPAELIVTDNIGCAILSATRLSCALGTLAAEATQSLDLQLEGEGNFTLSASLQSDSGDVAPGDTLQTLDITLSKKTSGGSLYGLIWIVAAALVYRRRKSRNQSSS